MNYSIFDAVYLGDIVLGLWLSCFSKRKYVHDKTRLGCVISLLALPISETLSRLYTFKKISVIEMLNRKNFTKNLRIIVKNI